MTFLALQRQLVAELQSRVKNGQITERGLARRAGLSQPHIHNVLKGKRLFSWEAADAVLHELKLTPANLLEHVGVQNSSAGYPERSE
jgi:hypothetical protein